MKTLCIHSLYKVYGGRQDQAMPAVTGCPYCDEVELDTVEVKGSRLGTPNIALRAGVGAAIGGAVGGYIGGIAGPVGTAAGMFVDSFDWEWYQQYREIAAPIEQEYSGGLP